MRRTASFCRQLARVLRSGLLIDQALPLAASTAGGRWVGWGAQWSAACRSGSSLAQAMAVSQPSALVALVRAGEASGRLPEVLERWADRCEAIDALRRNLLGRLAYPLLVINAALVVQALPGVMAGRPAWHLLLGPALFWLLVSMLALATWWSWRNGALPRMSLAPGLSWLLLPWWSADLLLVLSAGYAAGMRVGAATDLAAGACGNPVLASRLQGAMQAVADGRGSIAQGLAGAGLDAHTVALVTAGEQAGSVAESLAQAANWAADCARERSAWAVRILAGLVLAGAAVLTAWTVISIYAGVLRLASA